MELEEGVGALSEGPGALAARLLPINELVAKMCWCLSFLLYQYHVCDGYLKPHGVTCLLCVYSQSLFGVLRV